MSGGEIMNMIDNVEIEINDNIVFDIDFDDDVGLMNISRNIVTIFLIIDSIGLNSTSSPKQ